MAWLAAAPAELTRDANMFSAVLQRETAQARAQSTANHQLLTRWLNLVLFVVFVLARHRRL
jgi:hypothetical protein